MVELPSRSHPLQSQYYNITISQYLSEVCFDEVKKEMRVVPKAKWLNYLLVLTLFNVTLHLCYVYFLLQAFKPPQKQMSPKKETEDLWLLIS